MRASTQERIDNERQQQDEKWGVQNHGGPKWLTILMEEVGETAKALLESDVEGFIDEMVHVAAVAVAAIEGLMRTVSMDSIMYILYEKGVRVWGVGHTPMIARKEAEDHGANIYGKTIKVRSSGKKGDFCLKTCTLGVFNWYINSLYPEEFVWEEKGDGVLQLPGEDSQDRCPKCHASHAAEDICHSCGYRFLY